MFLSPLLAARAWGLYRDWRDQPVRVTALDVGQGDAIFCRLPGATVLVDAGPGTPTGGSGRKAILPFLRSQGIDRLDLVLITHPDRDHYGGLEALVGRIPMGKVLINGDSAGTQGWRSLRAALARAHIPVVRGRCGDLLYASEPAGVDLRLLGPCAPAGQAPGDRNDASLVALLRAHGRSLLLTGDIGPRAETALAAIPPEWRHADILKVSHHGSDRSTGAAFLRAWAPEVAWISVGRRNPYRHPGPATLARLRARGIQTYLTSAQGALGFEADRQGCRLLTFRGVGRAGEW